MPTDKLQSSALERGIAAEVSALLREVSTGDDVQTTACVDLCARLELYVPFLLCQPYPEWRGESLDGIRVHRAEKVGPNAIRIIGLGILIGDQTLTPVSVELATNESGTAVVRHEVSVGEPGGGALGISGPSCTSSGALRYSESVATRMESGAMRWVFRATGGEPPPTGPARR